MDKNGNQIQEKKPIFFDNKGGIHSNKIPLINDSETRSVNSP